MLRNIFRNILRNIFRTIRALRHIRGDQKVSVQLMIVL